MEKGIDVSHFNGFIDWGEVARAGYTFAYAKATEGLGMIDTTFTANITGAHAFGIKVGAYHFLLPELDGREQAMHFLREMERVKSLLSLPPVADVEFSAGPRGTGDAWSFLSKTARIAKVEEFLETVDSNLETTPMVYCSPGWWDGLFEGADFSKYPLWVANYGVRKPDVPASWKTWKAWQTSDHGKVPGVRSGAVDIDVWNGELP